MILPLRLTQMVSGLFFAVLAIASVTVFAEEQTEQVEFFENYIRPVLVERCIDCHDGSDAAESVLTFDRRESLIKGGDFGPAIIPGKSRQSLLWRAINGTHKELRMPPDRDDVLTRAEVDAFAKWIDDGAVWPDSKQVVAVENRPTATSEADLSIDQWSFPPLLQFEIPKVQDNGWARNDIDRFVWQKLEIQGLQPGKSADKRTLVRRMYLDLIGLPPTPDEMATALADESPDALAKLVDRLLASKLYGERWARHWLDVARYADTQGDVGDVPIPQAYRYRNWVIDALNADMPYDRFVQLQLAGDLMARDVDDLEKHNEMVIATGFLALSRRFGNKKQEDIHLTIEDSIDTISRGIMGVTLRCARCHDHKFDPMAMTDYYGLYGILASTRYPWIGMSNEKSPSELVPASLDPNAPQEADAYWDQIARLEYQINNHFRPWLKPTINKYNQLTKRRDKQKENGENTVQLEAEIDALLEEHDEFRELLVKGLPWVRRQRDSLAANPPYEMLFAVSEGTAQDALLHRRGNPGTLGDVVPRGFVASLGGTTPKGLDETSGRVELAQWITSPEHPLTARVIVNRVWQHHFGRGIVATPSNFGLQGSPPSHPELLDYLAESFIADGWSLKKLHRRILLSQVYQLASDDIAANAEKDPENIYLWKFSRRRLEAEAIRDSMLFVSGKLDTTTGGKHPFPAWYKKRYSLNDPFRAVYSSNRRSVYLMTQRLFKHPFLGLFDGPDRNATTERRDSSNVATQALYLMNSTFVQEQAEAFGNRIESLGTSEKDQIDGAYRIAFGRGASDDEQRAAADFLTVYRQTATARGVDNEEASQQAWASFAKVFLTSNEFFFID